MELTGGADCGALEGDEKSERVEEEAASGGSVRVDLPTRRCWTLHYEIAASSDQDRMLGDSLDTFATLVISIPIWLFRHNDWLGHADTHFGRLKAFISARSPTAQSGQMPWLNAASERRVM
jgi:hypothetical protein